MGWGTVRVKELDPGKAGIFSKTGRAEEPSDGKLRPSGEGSGKCLTVKLQLSKGVGFEWWGLC